jgi:hypothetical protein
MSAKQDNEVQKGNTMLRQSITIVCLALAAQLAQAGEAGKIIFVAGAVQVAEKAAALDAGVNEGDLLSTGADGYLYVRTIDKGLFILRPNTKARIATYHVDVSNPSNTRIKLELISGVARSRSGEAVKLARQNFRFNTPVAAIGVRGTDFSVFTDENTSRVSVISGGIVVSGFGGACRPEGTGPCEGNATRELSAAQKGQLLQVQRGQAAPQMLQGGVLAPDALAPPRGDEPIGKNGGGASNVANGDPNLDPNRQSALKTDTAKTTPPVSAPTEKDPSPVIGNAPAAAGPAVPAHEVSWGRFAAINGNAPTLDLTTAAATGERVTINPLFAIYRSKTGSDWQVPERGTVGFALKQSEAYVMDDYSSKRVPATLENGKFVVDFGASSFTTSFDLLSQADRYKMQAQGTIGHDGQLYGNSQLAAPTNMDVSGTLTPDGGVYLFQGRLTPFTTVVGATTWGK